MLGESQTEWRLPRGGGPRAVRRWVHKMDTMTQIVMATASAGAPGYTSARGELDAVRPFRARKHGAGNADLHIAPDSASWRHPV